MSFVSSYFRTQEELSSLKYYTIQGKDFYEEVLQEIDQCATMDFQLGKVLGLSSQKDGVSVRTEQGDFTCRWLIDTISKPRIDQSTHILCWQNFLGLTIETTEPVFEPDTPILMDFRTEQDDFAANFCYLLPSSSHKALIEYTSFTRIKEIDEQGYRDRLTQYIHEFYTHTPFETIDLLVIFTHFERIWVGDFWQKLQSSQLSA